MIMDNHHTRDWVVRDSMRNVTLVIELCGQMVSVWITLRCLVANCNALQHVCNTLQHTHKCAMAHSWLSCASKCSICVDNIELCGQRLSVWITLSCASKCYRMLCYLMLSTQIPFARATQASKCYRMLCYVMLHNTVSYVMLCYITQWVMLCYVT